MSLSAAERAQICRDRKKNAVTPTLVEVSNDVALALVDCGLLSFDKSVKA